jgi:hypothetical protein
MKLRDLCRSIVALLCLCVSQAGVAQHNHVTPFGSSEPLPGALHGRIYSLPEKMTHLPDFEALHPKAISMPTN